MEHRQELTSRFIYTDFELRVILKINSMNEPLANFVFSISKYTTEIDKMPKLLNRFIANSTEYDSIIFYITENLENNIFGYCRIDEILGRAKRYYEISRQNSITDISSVWDCAEKYLNSISEVKV